MLLVKVVLSPIATGRVSFGELRQSSAPELSFNHERDATCPPTHRNDRKVFPYDLPIRSPFRRSSKTRSRFRCATNGHLPRRRSSSFSTASTIRRSLANLSRECSFGVGPNDQAKLEYRVLMSTLLTAREPNGHANEERETGSEVKTSSRGSRSGTSQTRRPVCCPDAYRGIVRLEGTRFRSTIIEETRILVQIRFPAEEARELEFLLATVLSRRSRTVRFLEAVFRGVVLLDPVKRRFYDPRGFLLQKDSGLRVARSESFGASDFSTQCSRTLDVNKPGRRNVETFQSLAIK